MGTTTPAVIEDRAIARWRLASQHLTGPGLASAPAVVTDLLAVQAENHAQAAWAVAARTIGLTEDAFDHAFAAGEILRTHVIRPTWHFVRPDDIGWLLELTRPRIWRTWERMLERDFGIGMPDVERGTEVIVAAIEADGPLARDQLADRLASEGLSADGIPLAGHLAHAELHGLACSGPVRDGNHTWALLDDRAPDRRRLGRDEALAELARRYFTSHGPATERDLAYWATLTLADVRAGIAAVADELESFDRDGRTYLHGRPAPPPGPGMPRGHLLQLLDECCRGYQESRWVIDAEGIAPRGRTPLGMALVDAQLVAVVHRRVRPGTVEVRLVPFRTLAVDEVTALEEAAAEVGRFLERDATVTWT